MTWQVFATPEDIELHENTPEQLAKVRRLLSRQKDGILLQQMLGLLPPDHTEPKAAYCTAHLGVVKVRYKSNSTARRCPVCTAEKRKLSRKKAEA